ncbi:uncharacterized protein SPAPADRAFT_57842 [Spathaspora passalidarum NRRL Y-27907]|uniref:Uncharacterized protein n=1 Tax=Spathaspora passalidarum (strain NRRL Y-27907 / 11-Y1) TaxID=619300 RepID=G3AEL3_SPAPN|nr:uncharacterized protein SPAPADRAFT_57842 [Spathaspora passalidarum NRRL Y-27907]EGW34775.1 hypothetical protein SPAPADRAFT_57842 [Spathaspora passalidarum NRRL Y-27907]
MQDVAVFSFFVTVARSFIFIDGRHKKELWNSKKSESPSTTLTGMYQINRQAQEVYMFITCIVIPIAP